MQRIEKTVFISYRRTNFPWAKAIAQDLTQHGYDVFLDYTSIPAGDFESFILDNIRARAHFLIILTPSAFERINDPDDWLRREIETALATGRNVIPILLEGFDFGSPKVAMALSGPLAALPRFQALTITAEFFDAAMDRLKTHYLSYPVALTVYPLLQYSCFISYSSKDFDFAERLHRDLKAKGVQVWFAPEDLKTGDRFQDRIEQSIREYDRTLIILSESSVESPWVEREVNAAREREEKEGRTVLFPIRIDDEIMVTKHAWAADLRRQRQTSNFTRWKDYDEYKNSFNRLLRDLARGPE